VNRESIENGNSIHGIIIRFIKNSKEPVTMKEITEHILQQRELQSATPKNTIRGVIFRSKFIKKNIYAKYELID
jgi:hypothetical protein